MRKRSILMLAILIIFLVQPFVSMKVEAEEIEKIAKISGLGYLDINIATPSIMDLLSNITIIISVQRPDTQEFIDPNYLHVELSFMGFKMAEKDLEEMQRIDKGIYLVKFKPVGIPLLLDISVTARWTSPWGETVEGNKKTNILLNYFFNITGRLKEFFKSFLESHNITGYLHSTS